MRVKCSIGVWRSENYLLRLICGPFLWAIIVLVVSVPIRVKGSGQGAQTARYGVKEELDIARLKTLFRSPPSDRRILKIIHNFPKRIRDHDQFLKSLKERGFGGLVCNVHFDNYLRSGENWESFIHAVRMAKRVGMTLWLYDEKGYPSGGAGGLVLEGHPEWEARGVACVSATTDGSRVELKLSEGKLISASAFPLESGRIDLRRGVDLGDAVAEGGFVKWKPPEGRWMVMAFVDQRLYEGTHAEWNLHEKRPYPNLLMKEPIRRFIELTHQEYANRFADLEGTFEAVFTDEPSLMSVFLRPQPYPVIPWSPHLPARFRQDTGRDLIPLLPALFANAGPESGRTRCQFWRLVGEMVSEAYFGQIQDWCREHRIASTGHLLWEEDLANHVGFYGDFFRCVERLDIPGIDCLTSKSGAVPFHIAKLIGSIADLRGCRKTMSETSDHSQRYRPPGDKRPREIVSAAEIRATCNLLYVCGINTTTSYYSWAGLSAEEQRQVNEYVGRLGVMLTGGQHVCDIAVLYPSESLWAHFTPASHKATVSHEVAAINKTYRDVSSILFRHQLDYHYLDVAALRRAKVSGDSFEVGGERYRILILPRVDTLPFDVWRKMIEFWRGGGTVIAVGVLPKNTPSEFPSERVMELTRHVFGVNPEKTPGELATKWNGKTGTGVFIPSGDELLISTVIRGLYRTDCAVSSARSPLRYSHRRMADTEIYFLVNDSSKEIEEEVVMRSAGNPEIWDPNTGKVDALRGLATEPSYEVTPVRLRIEGFGSRFVTFDGAAKPTRKELNGHLVEKTTVPLEKTVGKVSFKVHKPKHVRCETLPDFRLAGEDGPALRIDSEITVGGADSWCFVEARFSPAADFSSYRGLRISTDVPEGQSGSGARLLVMLQEENGADYFSDSNRALNLLGWKTCTVWFDSFALAGWSKDKDGRLNEDRIAALRIGWGGYTGKKSERVCFAIGGIHLIGVKDDSHPSP
ncbi:hypothetical protein HQ563_05425 [bacterium]|nr:hypothetical protein [bacterium]